MVALFLLEPVIYAGVEQQAPPGRGQVPELKGLQAGLGWEAIRAGLEQAPTHCPPPTDKKGHPVIRAPITLKQRKLKIKKLRQRFRTEMDPQNSSGGGVVDRTEDALWQVQHTMPAAPAPPATSPAPMTLFVCRRCARRS